MIFRKHARLTLEEYAEKLIAAGLTEDGRESVSNIPMAPPIGYIRQPSLVETIRDMVRSEKLAEASRAAGMETFEESEDFDVGDEDAAELRSGFENDFDPPVQELQAAIDEAKVAEAEKEATPPAEPTPSD